MKPLTPDVARQRAETRCAGQECCLHDIREVLRRWGVEGNDAAHILNHLEQEGYINESRYAEAYVHDKVNYDRWGRIKIQAALRAKHIADADISKAMEQISDDLYRKNLLALMASKQRTLGDMEPQKMREKVARFLLSRGYEPPLVFEEIEYLDHD